VHDKVVPSSSKAVQGASANMLLALAACLLPMLQAAALTSQHESDADAAEGALAAMAAGFELEEATSRRNTAAPPSPYVMAGAGMRDVRHCTPPPKHPRGCLESLLLYHVCICVLQHTHCRSPVLAVCLWHATGRHIPTEQSSP
jgi:hypothetical protein